MAENTSIAGATTIEASNTPSPLILSWIAELKREHKLVTQFIDANHAKIAGIQRENEVHAERIAAIKRELGEVESDATDK